MNYFPLTKDSVIISNNKLLVCKCILCKRNTFKANLNLNKTICNACGAIYYSNKITMPKINSQLKYGILVTARLCDDLSGLEKINIKLREYYIIGKSVQKPNLYSFNIKYLNSTESNVLIKFIRDNNYSFDQYILFLNAITGDNINICDLFLFLWFAK